MKTKKYIEQLRKDTNDEYAFKKLAGDIVFLKVSVGIALALALVSGVLMLILGAH